MIELEEVKRLRLLPGDALVVEMKRQISRDVYRRIMHQFNETLPGVPVLILEPGITLEVLSMLEPTNREG